MSAIDNDAPEQINSPLTDSDAEAVFLKRFMPADADKQPSGKEKEQEQIVPEDNDANSETEETEETSAEEPEETEETESKEKDKDEKRKYADDVDTYVKIKVGDEEHEVPVKDLQRLYGQEASLTKKSMEVAEQRKTVDAEMVKAATASAALLERAKARFEPYSKIDFLLAAKELSAEEYTALRNEAQSAFDDVQFLDKNVNDLVNGIKQKQETDLVSAARESLKVLSGPVDKGGIEGWNEKLYDDIRAFAVAEGAPADTVNKLVDSWAIRLLHQAMLYKRGASKGVVITKKVNKTPQKVIKTTVSSNAATGKSGIDNSDKAMKRLRTTGSTDDAANVFLSRWSQDSD